MSRATSTPAPAPAPAPAPPTITVAQICLANAFRDEKQEMYRLGRRIMRFADFFEHQRFDKHRADVISIKELRECEAFHGLRWTPNEMVAELAHKGAYAIASCDPVKITTTNGVRQYKPFYMAQLYDAKKLVKVNSEVLRGYPYVFNTKSDEEAPHFGACLLRVMYAPLIDGTPHLEHSFFVESCHFPIKQEDKLRAAKWVDGQAHIGVPTIRIGDFNLFQDDPMRDEIYSTLTRRMVDATVFLRDQTGEKPMYGTFYPFPHDRTPVQIARPEENTPNVSKLDYVFVTPGIRVCHPPRVWTGLQTEDGIPLSDHLPLFAQLQLPSAGNN